MRETDTPRVIAGLRVRWRELGSSFGLWEPDDPDALLDGMTQDEFERSDERMPYFSAIWASAESLVAHLLLGPPLDGMRTLDLGCGLGPCGFAAAARGARVTFLDWEPRSLDLVAASARDGGWPPDAFELVVGDWRDPPALGPFDVILGADVLYERRNAPAVAAFLASHLLSDGEAWIADPGRPQAAIFPSILRDAGLQLLEAITLPPMPHGTDVVLYRIGRF